LLLHFVTVNPEPGRSIAGDYEAVRRELERYSSHLAERVEIVALTKADLPVVRDAYPEAKAYFSAKGIELHLLSSATHEGIDELIGLIARRLGELRTKTA